MYLHSMVGHLLRGFVPLGAQAQVVVCSPGLLGRVYCIDLQMELVGSWMNMPQV